MRLPFIVVFSCLSSLILGGGGNERHVPPSKRTTRAPPTTPSRGKPTSRPSEGRYQIDYGDFVYRSKKVTMILNVTKDGRCMFEIDCGRGPYRDGWFPLQKFEDDPKYDQLLEFPPGHVRRKTWLDNARAVCPGVYISDWDFMEFDVVGNGNVETNLHDDLKVLKRRWLPLNPGRYATNSSVSSLRLYYYIQADGFVQVKLGCRAGDGYPAGETEWKPYQLVAKGPGEPYLLTPTPSGDTAWEHLHSFEVACPLWRNSYALQDFETVRFATPDILFAFGEYPYDRLYRHPL